MSPSISPNTTARTRWLRAADDTDDVAAYGAIPLPVIQKYNVADANAHYKVCSRPVDASRGCTTTAQSDDGRADGNDRSSSHRPGGR